MGMTMPLQAVGFGAAIKEQIDKASKDNSDGFPGNFSVTLLMSRPGQDKETPQENSTCGEGREEDCNVKILSIIGQGQA